MAEKNKNENRASSPTDIYNSSESQHNRLNIFKEIQGPPRLNFSHSFEKTKEDRKELRAERKKWRKEIQEQGFGKRNVKMQTYLKVS